MFKKAMFILTTCLLVLSQVIAADLIKAIPMDTWRIVPLELDELDEDITIYDFDFEEGDDWTTSDLTGVGIQWHTSDYNAYDDGTSWWCGDEDLEGYNNHWLQYLESPELDLSEADDESLELTFMMYLDCEAPGGEPNGYDGWDGANVWYSTDGGDDWDVLEDPDPEYDSESLYSFGVEFGMGTGIAGWNGDIDDEWTEVTFDLSDFAGEESFMIRFTFCSDPSESTPDSDYLSFFLDDILIADDDDDYLENDAEDVAEPDDLVGIEQIGNGDFWELQDDEYHSETHAWNMTIEDELLCAIISPEIDIPFEDNYPVSFLTYWVYCNMEDGDGDGDNSLDDYYTIDISDDDGVTWTRLIYDYGYDNGEGNSLDGWVERTYGLDDGAHTEIIDLTPYEGETVRIRIVGKTDDNDDGGVGDGLFIDDVKIISSTGFDHDVGISVLHLPFPNTVDLPVPATVTFANFGANQEVYNAFWALDNTPYVLGQNLTLDPTETETFFLDTDADDGIDEWVPEDDGEFEIYARILLEDDYPDNNLTETVTVEVLPEGEYQFGYDDRLPSRFTTRFETGEGPITHFEIPDDLEPLKLTEIRILWNSNLEDEVDFDVHIFEGGNEPGDEIWEDTFTADTDDTYPDWHELDVTGIPELVNFSDDFWIWFELTETVDDVAMPNLVMSEELRYGEGHHYEFDGTTLVDADSDWMIRVIGEDVQPPEEFDLDSPEDGEIVDTATPTLSWEEAEDPDDGDEITYTLVWSVDDPDFTDADSITGIEENSYTFEEEQLNLIGVPPQVQQNSNTKNAIINKLEKFTADFAGTGELDDFEDGATVYWKVRAQDLNTAGIWSSPEDGWSFTVSLPVLPEEFDLVSPSDGEVLDTLDWLFTWETAFDPDDEVTYTIFISTDEDLTDPITGEAGTDTTIFIEELDDDTEHWWAVHADDGVTDGRWSDTFTFTTAWPQPPSAFNLLEPENEAVIELVDPFDIDFTWEDSSDPDPGEVIEYTFTIHVVTGTIDTTIEVSGIETPGIQLILPEELGIQYWEESMTATWGVTAISGEDEIECGEWFAFEISPYTKLDERMFSGVPTKWEIAAAFPNPFNPVVIAVVSLPISAKLSVEAYNIIGEQVAVLADGNYLPGYHKLTFDASGLSAGIYFIHASVPGKLDEVRKIVLIK